MDEYVDLDTVARAVRTASLDLPGGSVKTEGGEILLRAKILWAVLRHVDRQRDAATRALAAKGFTSAEFAHPFLKHRNVRVASSATLQQQQERDDSSD